MKMVKRDMRTSEALVTLLTTLCDELVVSAQRISAGHPTEWLQFAKDEVDRTVASVRFFTFLGVIDALLPTIEPSEYQLLCENLKTCESKIVFSPIESNRRAGACSAIQRITQKLESVR